MALDFLAPVPLSGAREVRRLEFAPQTAYDNGGLMCTSACACMCIMLLSGGIDTAGGGDIASQRRRGEIDGLGEAVGAVMAMASRVHGIVESGLRGRYSHPPKRRRVVAFDGVAEPEPPPGGPPHSMAGVWEVFRCLGMSPAKLGIQAEEFIVVGASRCGRTVMRTAAYTIGASGADARPRFLYAPSRCFITIGMIPDCLRTSDSTPCGCVLTCGGHSICAMHDGRGTFALFDPLPSSLTVGLTGRQLADEIARSPSMQSVLGAGRADGQCDATVFCLAGDAPR